MNLTAREKACVLAALRLFQSNTDITSRAACEHFSGENLQPLDDCEIDALCENINFGGDVSRHWEKTLHAVLASLYADLTDVGDDRNPESGDEYQSCQWARETLAAYADYHATHSENDMQPYTVVGVYSDNAQRFAWHVFARDELHAEKTAEILIDNNIIVAAVLSGHQMVER